MKNKILRILKNSKDFVSGEKMSEEFNMTRSGIWKYINMLKEDGYNIESLPRKGYRIVSTPDILSYEEIEEYLETDFLGRNLHYYQSIDSTNKKAKEIALDEKEGTVLIAEEQLVGRGRMGREWISPRGKGIWMSIILKPKVEPMEVSKITLLGAAAVNKALKSMNVDAKIKWPNDILIRDKKVCGILTEMNCELNMINYVVIGIGINVNLNEDDIPEDLKDKATSIKIDQGEEIDRKKLIGHILNEFEKLYIPFKDKGNAKEAIDICRENSAIIGREVKIIQGEEVKTGDVIDLNEDGELVVRLGNGDIENIFSGEISIRGMEGYI